MSPGAQTFRRAIVTPVRVFFMLPSGWRTHAWTGGGGGVRRLSRTESDMHLIAEGTWGFVNSTIVGGGVGLSPSADAGTHVQSPARATRHATTTARSPRDHSR